MSHTVGYWKGDTPEEFISSFADEYSRIDDKIRLISLLFEMEVEISWIRRTSELELRDRLE